MTRSETDQANARLVPVLLIADGRLVKTTRFRNPVYLGDPINAVRIFNAKAVDEITILDISATPAGRGPDFDLIAAICEEAFMPVSYGGGITNREHAARLLRSGADKVIINSALHERVELVHEVADLFGSQAVCASIDVRRSPFGKRHVVSRSARRKQTASPEAWARRLVEAGAGEIMLQDVDRDGTMAGYDHDLLKSVASAVGVPLVACGGARDLDDLVRAVAEDGVSAAAAGALFVFYGPHRAVLINPPSQDEFTARLRAAQPAIV
ncbi:AglZ/HisF2 family acetamidino modification protein [Alsobacter sp. R-9]